MKKYFLVMSVMYLVSYNAFGITWEDMNESKKRFATLEAFEAELEKYGLFELDKECVADKEESCFVLEKLNERELKYFLDIEKSMQQIEKEEKTPPKFDNVPMFLDKYFPGIGNDIKQYIAQTRAKRLQEAKEREMKKLKKIECQSTADVDGLKRYMECRVKTVRSKYRRLQEKYPNEEPKKIEQHWIQEKINGPLYYLSRSEKYWRLNLQNKKRSCTRHGNTASCVELQKMRKK